MGRFTDSVMAAIGLKPSDRVQMKVDSTEARGSNDTQSNDVTSRLAAAVSASMKETGGGVLKVPEESTQRLTSPETPEESQKDCLSCKVISSTVLFGMAGYVMYNVYYNKPPAHLKRANQRLTYITACIFLSSTLIIGGVARIFDLGLFSKDPEQELKNEVAYLYRFVGKEPPEFTKTKPEEGEPTS